MSTTKLLGKTILHREFLFDKHLNKTDLGSDCRLAIPKMSVERYFFKYFTEVEKERIQVEGEAMDFPIIDLDLGEEIEKKWVFKRQPSTHTYVILGGWKDFVRRKELKVNDVVQFWWHNVQRKFLISCLSVEEKYGVKIESRLSQSRFSDLGIRSWPM